MTKDGTPFVVVPTNAEDATGAGSNAQMAIHLFASEQVSLGTAARMADLPLRQMMDVLAERGIPIIRTSRAELQQSLDEFG